LTGLLLLACAAGPAPAEATADACGTWATVGQPFALTWCAGCHSSRLAGDERHGAPAGLDFESLDAVRTNAGAMRAAAVDGASMPPSGGPSEGQRAALAAWLDCGAPGDDAPIPVGERDAALLDATQVETVTEEDAGEVLVVATETAGTRVWTERWLLADDGEEAWIAGWEVEEDGALVEGVAWAPPVPVWDRGADGWTVGTTATDLLTGETRGETWTGAVTFDDAPDPRTRDDSPDTVRLLEQGGAEMGFQLSAGRALVYRWHDGASFQQATLGTDDLEGLPAFPLLAGLGWPERVLLREAR
jgi:hypothetical protein